MYHTILISKTILTLIIAITAILGFSSINQQAYAASMTFDTDTTITTDTIIAEGETWTVNEGVTLTIDSGVTITNFGIINNNGFIDNFGTINNACNGILNGTIPTRGNVVVQESPCDITPPIIGSVFDITQDAANPNGTIVNYDLPTVTDDTDPNPTISCEPESGSLFPIGSTTVTCTAQDASGNTSTVEFTVIVQETFCNDLTIDQLISSGQYNVIDNRDGSLGNILTGTFRDDLILASDAGNDISGKAGNDCIIGGAGNDLINGNLGSDIIFGQDGNDVTSGGFGNDGIVGQAGDDTISGQRGNDFLDGGIGDDSINGGLGDDTCISDGEDTTPAIFCAFFEN